jgi:hypothetical protein
MIENWHEMRTLKVLNSFKGYEKPEIVTAFGQVKDA